MLYSSGQPQGTYIPPKQQYRLYVQPTPVVYPTLNYNRNYIPSNPEQQYRPYAQYTPFAKPTQNYNRSYAPSESDFSSFSKKQQDADDWDLTSDSESIISSVSLKSNDSKREPLNFNGQLSPREFIFLSGCLLLGLTGVLFILQEFIFLFGCLLTVLTGIFLTFLKLMFYFGCLLVLAGIFLTSHSEPQQDAFFSGLAVLFRQKCEELMERLCQQGHNSPSLKNRRQKKLDESGLPTNQESDVGGETTVEVSSTTRTIS